MWDGLDSPSRAWTVIVYTLAVARRHLCSSRFPVQFAPRSFIFRRSRCRSGRLHGSGRLGDLVHRKQGRTMGSEGRHAARRRASDRLPRPQGTRQREKGYRLVVRNFYGVLHVKDDEASDEDEYSERTLLHGTINHGSQILDPVLRYKSTSYYGPDSGVGRAIQALQKRGPVRVGVVGLGAGVLSRIMAARVTSTAFSRSIRWSRRSPRPSSRFTRTPPPTNAF